MYLIILLFSPLIHCSLYTFVQPDKLEYPGDEYISLFPVFVNNNSTLSKDEQWVDQPRFTVYLRRMVYSLFSESTGTPLHLIFLTDDQSKDTLMNILKAEVGRVTTRKFFTGLADESQAQKKWKLPRFKVDLLSSDYFSTHYKREIDNYVENLCPDEFSVVIERAKVVWKGERYKICKKKFKWVQFLLAEALPSSFKRIILLDVDLRFRSDVSSLYQYFNLMSKTEKVGLAKDWWDFSLETAWYRRNNPQGLQIGEPYPLTQHLNSGVVLLDLDKIRKNDNSSTSIFNPAKIKSYIEEFNIPTWGDQIVYTLINWKEKNEVYTLPCIFNYQTLIQRDYLKNEDNIRSFPMCQGCRLKDYCSCKGEAKIEHYRHDRNLQDNYPTLFRYNKILKLSTWCYNSQWTHCY